MIEDISYFRRYLKQAADITIDGVNAIGVFNSLPPPLKNPQSIPRVIDVLRPALFTQAIISLHKLQESGKNPVSLGRCTNLALELSLITRPEQKVLKKCLSGLAPISRKISLIRNNLIAHKDNSRSPDEVLAEADLEREELVVTVLVYWHVVKVLLEKSEMRLKGGLDMDSYAKQLAKAAKGFFDLRKN